MAAPSTLRVDARLLDDTTGYIRLYSEFSFSFPWPPTLPKYKNGRMHNNDAIIFDIDSLTAPIRESNLFLGHYGQMPLHANEPGDARKHMLNWNATCFGAGARRAEYLDALFFIDGPRRSRHGTFQDYRASFHDDLGVGH